MDHDYRDSQIQQWTNNQYNMDHDHKDTINYNSGPTTNTTWTMISLTINHNNGSTDFQNEKNGHNQNNETIRQHKTMVSSLLCILSKSTSAKNG
jgi:hypothetical protein